MLLVCLRCRRRQGLWLGTWERFVGVDVDVGVGVDVVGHSTVESIDGRVLDELAARKMEDVRMGPELTWARAELGIVETGR